MAFIRKQDGGGGSIFKFETKGQSLTGVYLGSVDFEGDYGPTKKHSFKTEDGIKVVFGQAMLTDLLQGEEGKLVLITYASDKASKKGRPTKMYTLDVDSEYEASEDDMAAYAEDPSEQDDTPADEVVTAPASNKLAGRAPGASQKATVAALLNRKQ